MYSRILFAGLMFAALLVSCTTASSTAFSKEQAIKRATESARQSEPEVGIVEARIDTVSAELTTLGEADKRFGGERGPGGYSPGQTPNTPVWWVTIHGSFRYVGIQAPGYPPPMYEANERVFVYAANTGEEVGGRILDTRQLATVAPVTVPADSTPVPQPTQPTPVPTDERVTKNPRVLELLRELEQRGVTFELVGESRAEFLYPAPGAAYHLKGEWLHIHLFPSPADAQQRAAQIPGDARQEIIDWIDVPHFFRCDVLIVLYLGKDARVLQTLTESCGAQFAGS